MTKQSSTVWKASMQGVIKANGLNLITGSAHQTILNNLADSAYFINDYNTSSASDVKFTIENSGTGDAFFSIKATTEWIAGVNNAASDRYQIERASAFTITPQFAIDTGAVTSKFFSKGLSMTNTDDVQISFVRDGGPLSYWIAGFDDSDSDAFKISYSGTGDIGTGVALKITTGGVITDGSSNYYIKSSGSFSEGTILCFTGTNGDAGASTVATSLTLTEVSSETRLLLRDSPGIGNSVYFQLYNSTGHAAASAYLDIIAGDNSTAGDAYVRYTNNLSTDVIWAAGLDASDGSWKVSKSNQLGGNTVIECDTDLNLLLPLLPTSSAGLPSGAVYSDSGTLKIV